MATWAEHEAAAGLRQLREPEYDDAAVLCMMGLRRGSPLFIYADDAQHPRTKWWAASFLEALPDGGGFTFHYPGQPYDPRDGVRLFRDVGGPGSLRATPTGSRSLRRCGGLRRTCLADAGPGLTKRSRDCWQRGRTSPCHVHLKPALV